MSYLSSLGHDAVLLDVFRLSPDTAGLPEDYRTSSSRLAAEAGSAGLWDLLTISTDRPTPRHA